VTATIDVSMVREEAMTNSQIMTRIEPAYLSQMGRSE
jgi:hypothetical protein